MSPWRQNGYERFTPENQALILDIDRPNLFFVE